MDQGVHGVEPLFFLCGSRTSHKRQVEFGGLSKFQFLFRFFAFSIINAIAKKRSFADIRL
ncbi:hypothetical protein BZL41_16185 [Pseudomonas sp. PIC25]|nr:hypothetical protein BZL41_16185 [Pseudomonas sp. PIC25]